MGTKVKFVFITLASMFISVIVSTVGYYRFGVPASVSELLFSAGACFMIATIILAACTILGFKRFCKWMYFMFVTSLSLEVALSVSMYDVTMQIVSVVVTVLLILSLIPLVFKKTN